LPTLVPQVTALKAKLFRGFSDPSRLSILEALRTGPMTVSAITKKTALSRTNVSNHLRCLSDYDLVVSETRGRSTLYQLSDPRVATLLGLADVARGVYECTHYERSDEGC
jgi:DNA-binding transcriptional ArsR family regulator